MIVYECELCESVYMWMCVRVCGSMWMCVDVNVSVHVCVCEYKFADGDVQSG